MNTPLKNLKYVISLNPVKNGNIIKRNSLDKHIILIADINPIKITSIISVDFFKRGSIIKYTKQIIDMTLKNIKYIMSADCSNCGNEYKY